MKDELRWAYITPIKNNATMRQVISAWAINRNKMMVEPDIRNSHQIEWLNTMELLTRGINFLRAHQVKTETEADYER